MKKVMKNAKALVAWKRSSHKVYGECSIFKNLLLIAAIFMLFLPANAATKTAVNNGNWSSASTWSPSGVPASTDDVIIRSGRTITIDGNYTCKDLDLGNNNSNATTLRITTSGRSLTVTGALRINPSNKNDTYTFDAGPGTININGTFSYWSTSGTNIIQVSTGVINFTPAVAITHDKHRITFTGAGTINFNGNFSDSQNRLSLTSGCNVNFYGNYTVSGKNSSWVSGSTANFYGTKTVTATTNISFHHVNIRASAQTTFANTAGAYTIGGNLSLEAFGTLTANKSFTINGNINNDRGTISAAAHTITLNGSSQSINGPSAVSLGAVMIGTSNGSTDAVVTANTNLTLASLTLTKANKFRTFNVGSGRTVTVTGNLNFNQTGKDNWTQTVAVGSGTLTVNGNLVFNGNSDNAKRKCRLTVGSGTFNLNGNITWLANNAVVTEEITVASGTINFANQVSLANKSGMLAITGVGTINFNSNTSPCFTFGGGSGTAPILSTSSGSTVNFNKGLTAAVSPLTFAFGNKVVFKTNSTVTPTSAINFYHLKIDTGITLTAGGSFSVKGNWENCGTFTPSTHTVTFNGQISQTLSRVSGEEIFYRLTAATAANTIIFSNDVKVTNTITMSGSNFNLNGYTLTVGNNAAATLSRTLGHVYNGTWKRWFPASAITANSGSFHGLFPVGTHNNYRPVMITSTANPTTAGYVSVKHNNAISVREVTYTDNEGSSIEAIAEQNAEISTSGLNGGTYTLEVKYGGLGSAGHVSNLKMITYAEDSTLGSHGTHLTTLGPMNSPTARRSGLTRANLNNRWVVGTNDKEATPLYRYVYSRASGNWNSTSVWSFTPGGSGASCSCVPTSAGYAVINSGHTISVSANDSAIFVDVLSGGTLNVNVPRTLYIAGNLSLFGTGTFNAPGTLRVDGEIELSSSVSVSGDVVAGYGLRIPEGVTYTQTAGSLLLNGDLHVDGTMAFSSGVPVTLAGMATEISGTGTITTASGANINITSHKVITEGTSITFGSPAASTNLAISSDMIMNSMGEVTVYGNITGGNASTLWVNNVGSKLNLTGTLLSTGGLEATPSPNTINYMGTGAQTIKAPYYSYNILEASVSGTKTFTTDIQVDSMLVLGGSVLMNEGTLALHGSGGLKMTGTSELRLQRATEDDAYPELRGEYDLTGGTVTINQTGDSATVWGADYYNLRLNGSRGYDISSINRIKNSLEVINTAWLNDVGDLTVEGTLTHSSTGTSTFDDSLAVGTLNHSAGTINLLEGIFNFRSGNWTKSGGTFNGSTGNIMFTGSGAQTFSHNTAAVTFNSLTMNKPSGTLAPAGSITTLNLNGGITLNSGTMNLGSVTAINVKGNWHNDNAVFNPGSSTVTFNGEEDQLIEGIAVDQTFNHIVMNKPAGSLGIGGGTQFLTIDGNLTLTAGELDNGTASDIYAKGNWSMSDAATFEPGLGRVNFTGTGAQAINGTATAHTFHSMVVEKSAGTLSVGGSATALTLLGNLSITQGTFDKGTATNIYVGGNWANSGTFTPGTGTVRFNGATPQTISGSTTTGFYNLIVNKAAGDLTLSRTVEVSNALTLTKGIINTTSTNILKLGAAATSSAGSALAYVAGPMRKVGNTAFVFPVGAGGKWRRVGVEGMNNATTEITAQYFDEAPANPGSKHSSIDYISEIEYWDVDRTVTSDSVKLTFYWENAAQSSIVNCEFLTVAHYTGGQWRSEAATAGIGSDCSGYGAGSITTDWKVTSFSPFTLGSIGGGNALPVTLTDIKATPAGNQINVQWTTAAEINNRGFEVQRSTDGTNFVQVDWVNGNGTTARTQRYVYEDKNVAPNTTYYYRLKQIDFDEQFEYSPMVSARITALKGKEITWSGFIPNPAAPDANLVIKADGEGKADVIITNSFGQKVFQTTLNIYRGINNLSLDLGALPAGTYITEISLNGERTTTRLVRH